jgi:GTPase Era involved in 16S rRNA processing
MQFINNLVGEDVVSVSQSMESCTTDITHIVVDTPNNPFFNGRRLIVVDTPGFDDTKGDDLEILRRIALWLASS